MGKQRFFLFLKTIRFRSRTEAPWKTDLRLEWVGMTFAAVLFLAFVLLFLERLRR